MQRRNAFSKVVAIFEKTLGPEHPHMADSLEGCAALLRKMRRDAEAGEVEARAKAIRAQHAR